MKEMEKEREGITSSAPAREAIAKQEPNQGKRIDKYRQKTVLEQHCGFFDRDGDGVIWPIETYQTCREFGWGIPLSAFFAVFLHLVQSWGTVPWWHGLPDPFLRMWVKNVHFNKHGSSTMAFDSEGVFRPEVMEAFFDKFDTNGKGGLTFWEGFRGVRRVRMPWDLFGQGSAFFEWGMTYVLLWPEDGVVRKEDARRVLDGSIFHEKIKQDRRYAKANVNAYGTKGPR